MSSSDRRSAGVSQPSVLRGRRLGGVPGQVGALREVLPQQAVRVLVGAALPGAGGIAEVDRDVGGDSGRAVSGHLAALVPGQGALQMRRQRLDGVCERGADLGGSVPGREVDQRQVAGAAFDQGGDGGPGHAANDQIALPGAGTARSSASAGRSLIMTISRGNRCLRRAELRCGTFSLSRSAIWIRSASPRYRDGPPVGSGSPSLARAAVDADDPAGFRVPYSKIHKPKVFLPLTDQFPGPLGPPVLPDLEVHRTP